MTPTDMAERARDIANEFGLSIDVLDEARMEQEGMGSLLSVSHGSDQPAKLIVLPRIGHYELIDVRHPAWAACRDQVLRMV